MGEREGGIIWENGIETCKLSDVKRITSLGLMHDTVCSGLVHWDDPEGWYEEGGGSRVQHGECMYTPWWIQVNVGQNQYSIAK